MGNVMNKSYLKCPKCGKIEFVELNSYTFEKNSIKEFENKYLLCVNCKHIFKESDIDEI